MSKTTALQQSAIYEGTITHERRRPTKHVFSYRIAHVYLDLDEVEHIFSETRWWRNGTTAPASFRERDYLPGPGRLQERVRGVVTDHLGWCPDGPIRLLTQVRTFGISFNPVSFYYCFHTNGSLGAIVAEITNIPWMERHCYVLDYSASGEDGQGFDLTKQFHISPFMPLDQRYRWRFSVPGDTLDVSMINADNDGPLFRASLAHRRRALTPGRLDALLWRYPFKPLQVVGAIYFQALRLWLKGVPFYPHPGDAVGTPARSLHTTQLPASDFSPTSQLSHQEQVLWQPTP